MALGAHTEESLQQRTGEAFEQEHAIARWAAAVIRPGKHPARRRFHGRCLAHELRGFETLSLTAHGIKTMQELGAFRRVLRDRWPRRHWSG